ncbi:hypothetical protein [Bizionia echini]|uniref:hypothetical protein n=1 Tax=Bizionia echini TaxID=649333 RepID=UPI0015A6A4D0|nr:hypothetical protein [Bizionia echini]
MTNIEFKSWYRQSTLGKPYGFSKASFFVGEFQSKASKMVYHFSAKKSIPPVARFRTLFMPYKV